LPIVKAIFSRLAINYGAAAIHGDGDPELKLSMWAESLAGLSQAELVRGLSSMPTRFAPALAEFRLMCRPGLDPAYAWVEAESASAGRGEWSHEVVREAARGFGYELRTSTYEKCRMRWAQALNAEWQRWTRAQQPEEAGS
jgi:hypothetical protein